MYFVDGNFIFVRYCGETSTSSFVSERLLKESYLLVIITIGNETWMFQHQKQITKPSQVSKTENVRMLKSKVKSVSVLYFYFKDIFVGNLLLQNINKQSIKHFTLKFWNMKVHCPYNTQHFRQIEVCAQQQVLERLPFV